MLIKNANCLGGTGKDFDTEESTCDEVKVRLTGSDKRINYFADAGEIASIIAEEAETGDNTR